MMSIKLPDDLADTVRRALAEDIGTGDITAKLIALDARCSATIISREDAVLCGTAWFEQVFIELAPDVQFVWKKNDGDEMTADQELCRIEGPTTAILTGERTALNFLQTLSGTATVAKYYANLVKETDVTLLDTRKTLPGLRSAQKYAVRCGNCANHRMGLYDGVLIKENHITAAGSIANAVEQIRKVANNHAVEVEVESLDEVEQALAAGADILLLDNFSTDVMQQAVKLVAGRAKLEASGGVNADNMLEIAKTGVDYISIGAMTKHVKAIDLSMLFL